MDRVSLRMAARVVGATVLEMRELCAVVGAPLAAHADEIERETLDRIYHLLNHPDPPRKAA